MYYFINVKAVNFTVVYVYIYIKRNILTHINMGRFSLAIEQHPIMVTITTRLPADTSK